MHGCGPSRPITPRTHQDDDSRLVVGDVILDPLQRRAWMGELEVDLPRRPFAMLECLMEHRGHVVSRSRLFDEVWDDEVDIRSNALDVHISRLREHLTASRDVTIKTLRGVGYRLELATE